MELIFILTVVLVFLIVFTIEVIAPASQNSCDKRWLILLAGVNAFQSIFTVATGLVFTQTFSQVAVLQFSTLNFVVQGAAGFALTSFIAYWWHRAMHKFDLLWRIFHQLHHSPRRIEALSSFYMHPLDGIAATFLNAMSCYVILGLNAYGTAISLLIAAIYNIYIHADLRTPYWLGYLLQRPEMHRVHHKHMCHSHNYGLAIWDLLFGTFENPRVYVKEVGFDEDRERKIYDMLRGRDVYKMKS